MYRFELFSDWRGGVRWRLVALNGHVVATSDDRFRDADLARRAVSGMLAKLPGSTIIDADAPLINSAA